MSLCGSLQSAAASKNVAKKWRPPQLLLYNAINRRPVTPEVAGSSPVARATRSACKAPLSCLTLVSRELPRWPDSGLNVLGVVVCDPFLGSLEGGLAGGDASNRPV